mmetsp:Transcript_21486/g.48805  ORF Transcript_21486/g.48805 Transcript_21486/m.48805 type:complete len:677 (+) Transcript_21486:84-2114(+)
MNDHKNAKEALCVALNATDRCLAEISTKASTKTVPSSQKGNLIAASSPSSFSILQNEMIILSKECFYVLAHTCSSVNQTAEAQKCLDRIELYINEQRIQEDALFAETMVRCGDHPSDEQHQSPTSQTNTLRSNLEPQIRLDRANIVTRARVARSTSRALEKRERIHLAFARIMVVLKTGGQEDRKPSVEEEEEEHRYINRHFRDLVKISATFQQDTEKKEKEIFEQIFKLALTGSRHIFVKRFGETSRECSPAEEGKENPYDYMLLQFSSDQHKCQERILVDFFNAIITTIATLQDATEEESTGAKKKRFQKQLDDMGTKTADKIVKILCDPKNHSNNLLVGSEHTSQTTPLLQSFKDIVLRGLCIYRSSNSFHLCAKYADYSIRTMTTLQQQTPTRTIGSSVSSRGSGNTSTSTEVGEIMAIKAFSLSMLEKVDEGLHFARKAWSHSLGSKSIHNMAILFHCSVRKEMNFELLKGTAGDNSTEDAVTSKQCDALLELDDSITHLIHSRCCVDDIIDAFPALAKTCIDNESGYNSAPLSPSSSSSTEYDGGGRLLLGICHRWIGMLTLNDTFCNVLLKRTTNDTAAHCTKRPPGGSCLFRILRSYLYNYENMFATISSPSDKPSPSVVPWPTKMAENLIKTVDAVLRILKKVRDRRPPCAGTTADKKKNIIQTDQK